MQNLYEKANQPVSINKLTISNIATSRHWIDMVLGFDSSDLDGGEIDLLRPAVYQWTAQNSSNYGYYKIHDACRQLTSGEYLVSEQTSAGAMYFIRNPLDVAISLAHHNQILVDEAIKIMNEPDTRWCISYRSLHEQLEHHLLNWSGHVISWVDNKAINIKVVRFEDMKYDAYKTFSSAAKFLKLQTDRASIELAIKYSNFKELQVQENNEGFVERRKKSHSFFRKGEVGDWQDILSNQQILSIVNKHYLVMKRFGYLDNDDNPQVM